MSRIETTEDWILEDLAAITGKDIKELRKSKVKTKSTPVNRHKYFRRPGKRHNNDFCYSCREGGTLICCDGCTKSFHLLCLDPPMEDEDIPEGEWLCKTCKLGRKPTSDGVFSLKFLSRKRKRSIEDDSEESKEAKLIRSIWTQLIRKALESDPKEYENPLDCRTIPYIFPGDSKNTKKNQIKLKHPHSTQCYICEKGLSKQSMINCDYCERSFHLDCTDPPLTIPPKYFWMCQFHIEPCLERIFYQEEIPSLSQRIALWDMCRKPIDHEAVKLEFLRNTVTDKHKIVQLPTVPIDIPDAVYNHYNNRPDMIPSLKEALRLVGYDQSIEFLQKVPTLNKNINNELKDSDNTLKEEQELWLATILGFQKELVSKLNKGTDLGFFETKTEKCVAQIEEKTIEPSEKESIDKEENSNSSETLSNKSKSTNSTDKIKVKRPHDEITKILEAAIAELPEASECLNIMNYLDEEFVNVLAFQRLCQLSNCKKHYSKLTEEKKLYEIRSSSLINQENKSLTNPQLEKYVNLELRNTLKDDALCSIEKSTDEVETIIISDGENYRRLDKEDLKKIIEKGVAEEDDFGDKNDTLINVDDIKTEEKEENETSQDFISDEALSTGVEGNVTQISSINYVCDKDNIDENAKDKTKSEIQDNKIYEDRITAVTTEGDGEKSVVKCEEVSLEKGIAKVPLASFYDNMCGESKILGVLTAVARQTELFPIFKSGFVIGKGSTVHLDLNKCGHCNFISNHHAVIYVDERTHLWEIINYSRYGCRVNNVLLSFDVPKKSLQNILDEDSEEEFCSFHESIKTISQKQLALLDTEIVKSERDEIVKKFYKNPCNCDPKEMHSNMSSNGWNNSVPFGHGSLLQFGCIGLVFGDTSYVVS